MVQEKDPTLLHEMIQAYLFVTNNDNDRQGRCPEFCKRVHRIGNLTIYPTFRDRADEYRRRWWLRNGPRRFRKPSYGYGKRATNGAPPANGGWAEHQNTRGGARASIKEPDSYSENGKAKTKAAAAATKASQSCPI